MDLSIYPDQYSLPLLVQFLRHVPVLMGLGCHGLDQLTSLPIRSYELLLNLLNLRLLTLVHEFSLFEFLFTAVDI